MLAFVVGRRQTPLFFPSQNRNVISSRQVNFLKETRRDETREEKDFF